MTTISIHIQKTNGHAASGKLAERKSTSGSGRSTRNGKTIKRRMGLALPTVLGSESAMASRKSCAMVSALG